MTEGFDVGLEMSCNPSAFRDMLANMAHGAKISMLGIPTQVEVAATVPLPAGATKPVTTKLRGTKLAVHDALACTFTKVSAPVSGLSEPPVQPVQRSNRKAAGYLTAGNNTTVAPALTRQLPPLQTTPGELAVTLPS